MPSIKISHLYLAKGFYPAIGFCAVCFQVSQGAESSSTAQHSPHQLAAEHVNTQHKIFRALQQRMQVSPSETQSLLQGTLGQLQGINSELQLSTVQMLKAVPELKQEFEAEVHKVLSQLVEHLGCEVLSLSLTQPFRSRTFIGEMDAHPLSQEGGLKRTARGGQPDRLFPTAGGN